VVKANQMQERAREGQLMKDLAQREVEHEQKQRADHEERAGQMRKEFVEANNFLM